MSRAPSRKTRGSAQPHGGLARGRRLRTLALLVGALVGSAVLGACASERPASTATAVANASHVDRDSAAKPKDKPTFDQARKFTKCMRAHGVKNFPEPTLVDGQIVFSGASGIGREPDFLSAQSACSYLLGGPPVGGGGGG